MFMEPVWNPWKINGILLSMQNAANNLIKANIKSLLTFLQRAKAIIVIKFPGIPTRMKTMHAAVAKYNSPAG